jgi:hypothetical protein
MFENFIAYTNKENLQIICTIFSVYLFLLICFTLATIPKNSLLKGSHYRKFLASQWFIIPGIIIIFFISKNSFFVYLIAIVAFGISYYVERKHRTNT